MNGLRAKATRYMSIEENVEARKRKSQPHVAGRSRFPKRSQPEWYNHYTALNATKKTVLQETCNLKLIQLSRPK